MYPSATMVTSVPARFTDATPIGTGVSASATSSSSASIRPGSKHTTGLLSRIALVNRPLASAAPEGRTTLSPARCAYSAYPVCECWAAERVPLPYLARNTIGKSRWPPNM
jgi:hypothetical protein